MHRLSRPVLPALFVCVSLLAGCSKAPRPAAQPVEEPAEGKPADAAKRPVEALRPERSAQEKYDAALLDAVNRMAERDYRAALLSLEAARAAQDTEQVRREIERMRTLLEQQAAAERTLRDIQIVLDDGKPEEASRLAAAALRQYGGSDAAERLAQIKRQADALLAAQTGDAAARRNRFRTDAEAALREKNLRAAALAFEQALQDGEDPDLRKQLDAVRADLARYDDLRRRAAELRRDPANLEEALAALQEAAKVWDTPQVQQEIDECALALQRRRDRLGVADFEVRGEVGMPFAGRVVADELLPAFKQRFDLVERGQLKQVVEELRLEAGALADDADGRREVGRLARLRYLVVGSITPLNGVTVHARLVDVQTGLIVQTARLAAPSADELLPLLPQLANLLQMTDEQRLAAERPLAEQGAANVRPAAPFRKIGFPFYDAVTLYETTGRVRAPQGLGCVEEVQFLRRLTDRPIKVAVPGPLTLLTPLVVREGYARPDDLVDDLAGIVRRELVRLQDSGCAVVQIDEPAFHDYFARDLGRVTRLFNDLVAGLRLKIALHVCFGNYAGRPRSRRSYRPLLPFLREAQATQLVLEFANREMAEIELWPEYGGDREFACGVVDQKSFYRESPQEVAERVRLALRYVAPDKLWLNPDCGMQFTPRWIGRAKLRALVEGVRLVRRELAGSA